MTLRAKTSEKIKMGICKLKSNTSDMKAIVYLPEDDDVNDGPEAVSTKVLPLNKNQSQDSEHIVHQSTGSKKRKNSAMRNL